MKPGSLVILNDEDPIIFGIIIRKSTKHVSPHNPYSDYNSYSDRWWEVLRNNKIIVELEEYLKLVG